MLASSTAAITAAESGETTKLMPRPISVISGSTCHQNSRAGARAPRSAKETATTAAPRPIGGPAPIRSDRRPATGPSVAINAEKGMKIRLISASERPQPAITVCGR